MGIYNYDRLRMGNLLPTQTGSGYKLYDQFLASVLPLLNQSRAGNRRYDRSIMEDEQAFKTNERIGAQEALERRDRLQEIGDMQRLDYAERNKPMNVNIDRSWEISPYQQAQLNLQSRGIDVADKRAETTAKTAEERLGLEERRIVETERKNKVTEEQRAAKLTLDDYKVKNPQAKFNYSGPTVMMTIGNKIVDTGVKTGNVSDEDRIRLNYEADVKLQEQKDKGGGIIFQMQDPNDPTKSIPFLYNPETKKGERITVDGMPVQGPITKPGTPSSKTGKTVQPQNLEAIRAQTQEVLDLINNEVLSTSKEGKRELSPKVRSAVGWSGLDPRQILPESESRGGVNVINRLKAQQIVNLIGEMKAQSRTGATGFGQLNMKELGVLENAAHKLDRFQDPADFLAEVERIRERLELIMKDAEEKEAAEKAKPELKDIPGTKLSPLSPAESLKKAQETLRRLQGGG